MHSHTALCRALAHPQPSAREGVMILIGGKSIVGMHWPSSKKIQGTITVVLRNGHLITAGHVVGEVGSPVYAPIADNGDFSDDNLRQVGKVVFNPFIAGEGRKSTRLNSRH